MWNIPDYNDGDASSLTFAHTLSLKIPLSVLGSPAVWSVGTALYTARAQMKPLMIAGFQHGGQVGVGCTPFFSALPTLSSSVGRRQCHMTGARVLDYCSYPCVKCLYYFVVVVVVAVFITAVLKAIIARRKTRPKSEAS